MRSMGKKILKSAYIELEKSIRSAHVRRQNNKGVARINCYVMYCNVQVRGWKGSPLCIIIIIII